METIIIRLVDVRGLNLGLNPVFNNFKSEDSVEIRVGVPFSLAVWIKGTFQKAIKVTANGF